MYKKYITTPIYYVNDIPHIGHAYTTIAADVLTRYWKKKGENTFFLTGTDEHGAKIAEAAEKRGKEPKEFADELIPMFKKAWKSLNIEYDQFFRTTNPKHERIVQELIEKLHNKGYVEKRKYKGLYCIGCERYYKKDELINGKCPDHKREPVEQTEENYFLLLPKIVEEKQIYKKIENDEIKVRPESRKNEILGKIESGLEDVSISRQAVKWGVSFPKDSSQTVYVWVDALINYYSATRIYEKSPDWPADIHLMAKDILWFHAIIWPAILLGAGLNPPKEVFAHGYFTIDGEKMSKSLGNVLDPIKLAEKYGEDAVRYTLLKEFPFGEDGDISEERIKERYEKDLGNELGNLVQRTLAMISKYGVDISPSQRIYNCKNYDDLLESCSFNEALKCIWNKIKNCNQYIEENKPWELAKDNPEKLKEVLSLVYGDLEKISDLIYPFMPGTSERMKEQLKSRKPKPLFPRID